MYVLLYPLIYYIHDYIIGHIIWYIPVFIIGRIGYLYNKTHNQLYNKGFTTANNMGSHRGYRDIIWDLFEGVKEHVIKNKKKIQWDMQGI